MTAVKGLEKLDKYLLSLRSRVASGVETVAEKAAQDAINLAPAGKYSTSGVTLKGSIKQKLEVTVQGLGGSYSIGRQIQRSTATYSRVND